MARPCTPMVDRFWRNVKVGVDNDCWIWVSGCKTKKGYGVILEGGRGTKVHYTHRYSYRIHKGQIPEGILVLHSCDNPSCVNPSHLFLGTQSDNMNDMISKNRRLRSGPLKGTGAKSKLSTLQLIALREDAKIMTQQKLAEKYGIGQNTVSRILRGKSCQNLI